jgi:FkbM family methyltransferase
VQRPPRLKGKGSMSPVVTCRIGDVSVLLDLDSTVHAEGSRNHELWRAETYATKEPDTIAWIDEFFRPGDVMYDVGANIGQYALYAAKRLGGECKVLAFEPESLNYAKLNRNIVLNGLADSVMAYCLALTDRTRFDTFHVGSFAPGAALHALGQPLTQGEKPFASQHQQGALGMRMDDMTGRFALPFPNHVKIDVDGLEGPVIRGAEKTLADRRLRTALVEVFMHKDIAAEIKAAFFHCGFALRNADSVNYTQGAVQNLIFTR